MTITHNHLGQPVGFDLGDWMPPPFPAGKTLQGRYCRLEPADAKKHAEDLHEANLLDEEGRNWTYLPYGPFTRFENYQTWLGEVCQGRDPLFYVIIDTTSGQAVGLASFLRIKPAAGSIEVGHINYSPRLQKTTAATEAMVLMMKHAFELGYRRYEWKCDALNASSRAAAQRLGFSFEGVFRQAVHYKGRNRDTAWYAVIDQEWPLLAAAFTQWLDPANFDNEGKQRISLHALTNEKSNPRS